MLCIIRPISEQDSRFAILPLIRTDGSPLLKEKIKALAENSENSRPLWERGDHRRWWVRATRQLTSNPHRASFHQEPLGWESVAVDRNPLQDQAPPVKSQQQRSPSGLATQLNTSSRSPIFKNTLDKLARFSDHLCKTPSGCSSIYLFLTLNTNITGWP